MAREQERRAIDLAHLLGGELHYRTPPWLMRPGRDECGERGGRGAIRRGGTD